MASDVGSGALMANAGAVAAAYNVRINLKSIVDDKFSSGTKNTLNKFKSGDILVLQNEINKIEEIINRGYEIGMKIFLSDILL